MRMPPFPWDQLSFVLKVEATHGAIGCANWLTTSLHYITVALYILTAKAIDTALAAEPDVDLIEPVFAKDASINPMRTRNMIYLTET